MGICESGGVLKEGEMGVWGFGEVWRVVEIEIILECY
jgi:hypothetical protein